VSQMGRHVAEGRVPAVKDALLVVGLAKYVSNVFGGLLRAWEKQTGLNIPEEDERLKELDRYSELVDYIFFEKPSASK
jgi:hypothetical protein